MLYYLLVCRSLTYAQRTVRVLERSGISAALVRTPPNAAKDGCGYSVKMREPFFAKALSVLRSSQVPPRKIYKLSENGDVTEVQT